MAAPGRSFIRFSIISISIRRPSTLQDVKDAAASAPKPCVCTLSGCSLESLFKKLPLVTVCCRLPYHHTRMKLSWFPWGFAPPPPCNSDFNIKISATNGKSPHNQLPTYLSIPLFSVRISNRFCSLLCSFPNYRICCICLWIVILIVVVVFFSREGDVSHLMYWHWKKKKKAFVLFFRYCSCSVHIGRFIRLSLFNEVFGFISSIGTHGIHICVVWSCNFFFSFLFLSVQINVIVSISFFRCLNKMCFLQIQGVQVCGIKRVIIQTTDFLQIKAYTVTEANVFSFALWGLISYMISFGHLSIHIQSLVPKW